MAETGKKTPKTMNIVTLLEKMKSGRLNSMEDYKNMKYGIRVTTMEAEERFRRSENAKIKHECIYDEGSSECFWSVQRTRRPELNCNRGEKTSVIPPLCEQVTSALFLNNNDLLVGGGVSNNQLFFVSMKEVRNSNRMFKMLGENKINMAEYSLKMTPNTCKSVKNITEVLPKTKMPEWSRGVKGLEMNEYKNLIICSAKNGCDLAVLKLDQNIAKDENSYAESSEVISEAKNVKNPYLYTENTKFKMKTSAGTVTSFGMGSAHSRPISDMTWWRNQIAVTSGEDGLVAFWNLDKDSPKEMKEEWPNTILSITEAGVVKISNRLHQQQIFCVDRNKKRTRSNLVGVDEIEGTEMIVTCASEGSTHIIDGNEARLVEKRWFPSEHLPGRLRRDTGIIIDQDVCQDSKEIIVATAYKLMITDPRTPTDTILNISENELMFKHGFLTAVNTEDKIIAIGHRSGAISFYDRRNNKIFGDVGEDRSNRQIWSLGPSWQSQKEEACDTYPVRVLKSRGHRLLAGGGPIYNNGEYWSMSMLTLFE